MIEESLLKSNILGKDGFVWWIGRVAHPQYWRDTNIALSVSGEMAQRCKVRIIGYHPWDSTLKEEDLPWAHILMDPITGSGQGGRGVTNALVGGETCVGFFLDGEDGQQPVIIGLLNRSENVENSIKEREIAIEKSSQFKVFTGHTGNVIPATKRPSPSTNPVSPGNTGSANSQNKEAGVFIKDGKTSSAAAKFEKLTTKTWKPPSKCGTDLIGRMTRILQDFIAFVNGLEFALNEFVDPVLNEVVNMAGQIKSIAGQLGGIVKLIINNMRDGIIKCIISLFKKFLGIQKKTNPADFATAPAAQKATKSLLEILYCIFENLIDEILDFIFRMLENLLGRIVNGPACAAEQFISGLMAKVMELVENALDPILSGINWLTGGIGNVTKVLSEASNLATQIYNFIGCDGMKCDEPSEWISSTNAALQKSADDWQKQVKQINVFKDISSGLGEISSAIGNDGFGIGEDQTYNGSSISGILQSVDTLTGGQSASALNKGLGSIESAIATMPLFGGNNSIFDACNQKTFNPQTQDDLIRMPLGYKYSRCIPPKVETFGDGSGAKLRIIVGSDSRIFEIKVLEGGSGYSTDTTIAIIDNSGYGSGAQAKPIIVNGSIQKVVLLSRGFGYCGGDLFADGDDGAAGIGSSIIGDVDSVYIVSPGIGYTSGDTVSIGNTNASVNVTPNGSIVSVNIPSNFNQQFATAPLLIINTNTGVGADLIPIMRYNAQFTSDTGAVRPLVGIITSVIDCV